MSDEPATTTSPKTAPVTLENAIKREGGDIIELVLRKPKAGDLRGGVKIADLIQTDGDALMKVLPRIVTPFLTDDEIANLEAEDIAEIAGVMVGFFLTQSQKVTFAKMQDR